MLLSKSVHSRCELTGVPLLNLGENKARKDHVLIQLTHTQKRGIHPPLPQGKVSMYTCGPTVHHYAHIGNLRDAYIMEDILEKTLRYSRL